MNTFKDIYEEFKEAKRKENEAELDKLREALKINLRTNFKLDKKFIDISLAHKKHLYEQIANELIESGFKVEKDTDYVLRIFYPEYGDKNLEIGQFGYFCHDLEDKRVYGQLGSIEDEEYHKFHNLFDNILYRYFEPIKLNA